jgi:hypothetical protein
LDIHDAGFFIRFYGKDSEKQYMYGARIVVSNYGLCCGKVDVSYFKLNVVLFQLQEHTYFKLSLFFEQFSACMKIDISVWSLLLLTIVNCNKTGYRQITDIRSRVNLPIGPQRKRPRQ